MERLILFARAPARRGVKTRMVPPLTEEQAAALHEAMVADQTRFVAGLAGASREAEIRDTTRQGEGDLGERMARAFHDAFEAGIERAVIVGGDAPTLPAAIVEDAFSRLAAGARAVIAPALDGGYVLVGATPPCPPLFDSVPWGTAEVAGVTRRLAVKAGIVLHETRAWGDVDTAADLPRLRDEILRDPERAPKTAAALAKLPLYFARDAML